MSYVNPDYASKKEFKGAVLRYNAMLHALAGLTEDTEETRAFIADIRRVFRSAGPLCSHETYNPSGMFPTPQNGDDVIEGPHYPKPHRWYAAVRVRDGRVVSVK